MGVCGESSHTLTRVRGALRTPLTPFASVLFAGLEGFTTFVEGRPAVAIAAIVVLIGLWVARRRHGRSDGHDQATEAIEASPQFEGPRGLRRVAPALGLLLLAPLIAEYLLGNVSFSELPALPFLVPMYGGAALLIRELARRTGRGWPTIFLLAAAYGLFQPAVLDQSLFNPSYMDHDFQSAAHIPALGISAYYAMAFVAGHTFWSVSVPIAIVEAMVPTRTTTPWLGTVGLVVTGGVFLLGAGLVYWDHQLTEDFSAPTSKLLGAAGVSVGLIGLAFAAGRRPRPRISQRAPSPTLVGVTAFVASTGTRSPRR